MIRRLKAYFSEVRSLESDAEFSAHKDALIRVSLQYVVFALAEWVVDRAKPSSGPPLSQDIDFQNLRKPADGTLSQMLSKLVVECENLGWKGISKVVWGATPAGQAYERLLISEPSNLEGLLLAHVRRRNDGAGHGLPGGYDREAEESLISNILAKLEPIVPVEQANLVLAAHGAGALKLKLLRPLGGIYVVRQIKPTKAGQCVVQVQIQRSLEERQEHSYETEDILLDAPEFKNETLDYVRTEVDGWEPLASVPDPLTEAFSGRDDELEQLRDWFNYLDSKACLVFGDGGMGKTTLVVEFLARLMDGRVVASWRPDLIFFYTAKRTRWGLEGLETINPAIAGASDIALSLARAIEGAVGREWYSLDSAAAISRVATVLQSYGLDRNQVLLVIDNAETLAQNDEDVVALSKALRALTRHVGRVIVTSRRREHLEAQTLEIPPLSDDESESLLRKRAAVLRIRHILQAGSGTLRSYARKLGCKPLVLEVFVQSLTEPETSLEKAFARVQQMQNQDLGEFLYADAWQRLGEPLRRLLLLMSRIGEVHDEILLKLCASECGVSVLEAQRAIDESRGIASVSRVAGGLHVAFTPEFMRFCSERTTTFNGKPFPQDAAIEKVGRRYQHFQASANKHVFDRTGMAFRHPLARAAYRAASNGNDAEAEVWYELAVGTDSSNAALHDRYAYFLMSRGQLARARDRAASAVQLEPSVAEFWFTKGIIESKEGRGEEAISSLGRAQKLGKPPHLCALQQAYAYTKLNPPDYSNARAALLTATNVPADDPYKHKHQGEVDRLRRRISAEARIMK